MQLRSFHRLARLYLKFFTVAFSSMWTENLRMYKLGLEKAEEPEIKLPAFTGSQKKQESSRKKSTPTLLTMPKPFTVWITTNCGKFLKRWEYQTRILLRILYEDQEATIRTLHGTTNWFNIGKGVWRGCILSLCLFNFHAEYIMGNIRLDQSQARIKIAEKISTTSDMQMISL